jgi:C-terminal processing protease CtpA/Prc
MKKLLLTLLVLCAAPAAAQATVAVPQQPGGSCQGYSFRMESSDVFGTHDYPQITAVRSGSPADVAGLRVGDLLVQRDGRDLLAEGPPPATRLAPGDTVVLLVRRDGRDETLRMVAGEIVAGPNDTVTCRLWTAGPASEKRPGT